METGQRSQYEGSKGAGTGLGRCKLARSRLHDMPPILDVEEQCIMDRFGDVPIQS